jgi:hypothetical protein
MIALHASCKSDQVSFLVAVGQLDNGTNRMTHAFDTEAGAIGARVGRAKEPGKVEKKNGNLENTTIRCPRFDPHSPVLIVLRLT